MNHSLMLYSPSDFSSMDSAQQATMDRYNGIFSPLEISAEAFKAAYDTPDIGPHIEKDYKGLSYLSWPFAYRYLKEHFPPILWLLKKRPLEKWCLARQALTIFAPTSLMVAAALLL